MVIRYLKIIFVALISLLCLSYAGQNVANPDASYQAFSYAPSGPDHQVYISSFFPAIQSQALTWVALAIVVSLEFLGGRLAAKEASGMWSAGKEHATTFNDAKAYSLPGCRTGIVVWPGLFGGALFQMWQTEIVAGSLQNAQKFFVACASVFLIVNTPDE